MSDKITNKVSDYYSNKVRSFGATPQGVDWNSIESQTLRFKQLISVLPEDAQNHFSLLDYGCGYGAMYDFLKDRFINISYYGYDISEEMINAAQLLHKNDSSKWVINESELLPVDFVVASGIFNVKMDVKDQEWLSYILQTLNTINSIAKNGFAFNILTGYSDRELMKSNLFYADPAFLFDYCKREFSPYVALLHDYPLYEFTILVRK